jgi:hypothetical protein
VGSGQPFTCGYGEKAGFSGLFETSTAVSFCRYDTVQTGRKLMRSGS